MNHNDFNYGVRIRQATLENNPGDIEQIIQEAADHNISAECLRTYVRSARLHGRPQLDFLALRNAVQHDFSLCVEQLIKIASPSEVNEALQLAANLGHVDSLRLLIPLADPKDRNSKALAQAVLHGHSECVDLLFDISDPQVVLKNWSHFTDPQKLNYLREKIQRQQDLTENMPCGSSGTKSPKI